MNNIYVGHKTKRKKVNKNKIGALKTLMQHTNGLPPSCNWSNSFSSIKQDNYLIYISNSYIVVINITLKSFEQILSSNRITGNDRPNVLLSLSPNSFLTITEKGMIILFNKKQRPNNDYIFIEKLNLSTESINMQSVKTALFIEEKTILFVTSKSNFVCFKVLNENEFRLKNEYCISLESDITEISLIGNDICCALMNGSIVIFDFINNSHSIRKKKIIDSIKSNSIYSVDYSHKSKLFTSIDKNGTLALYDSESYQCKLIQSNQFNDKSINEHYLYFAIKFLPNDNLLVSSNEGRVFIFNHKVGTFTELSENPHTQSIFNIIVFEKEAFVAFVSSDHLISFYSLTEMNLEYTLRTIPSKPSTIFVDRNESKVYFTTNNDSALEILSYCYNKKHNRLLSFKRGIPKVINVQMIKLIKELIGILMYNEVLLYDYQQDLIKHRIELDSKAVAFDFIEYDDYGIICLGFTNCSVQIIKYPIHDVIISNTLLLKEEVKGRETIASGDFSYFKTSNQHWVYITHEYDNKVHVYIFNEVLSIELYSLEIHSILYKTQVDDCFIQFYLYKQKSLTYTHIPLSPQIHLLKYNVYDTYSLSYKDLHSIKDQIMLNLYQTSYINLFPQDQTSINLWNTLMITTQANGVILVYSSHFNNNTHTLILMNLIKAHYSKISDLCFISSNTIASISSDQSLKMWNTDDCIQMNILCNPTPIAKENQFTFDINYFSRIQDDYFYQQSSSNSKQFTEDFKAFFESVSNEALLHFDVLSLNHELLLFAFFNNKQLNYITVVYLLQYERDKKQSINTSTKKYNSVLRHIGILYGLIQTTFPMDLQKSFNGLMLESPTIDNNNNIENDWINELNKENSSSLLNSLIHNNHFVDALILIKVLDLGIGTFVFYLNMIKTKIFTKQMFQAIKIEKIIQVLQKYHNIN